MKWITMTVLMSMFTGQLAHADQCQGGFPTKVAQTAVNLIKISPKILAFCQPCGEKAPTEIAVTAAEVSSDGEVYVNQQSTDLAYTYVQITKGTWVNLALLSDCYPGGDGIGDVSQFVLETKGTFIASPIF